MYFGMATEENKKTAENWKADADGILIFVLRSFYDNLSSFQLNEHRLNILRPQRICLLPQPLRALSRVMMATLPSSLRSLLVVQLHVRTLSILPTSCP